MMKMNKKMKRLVALLLVVGVLLGVAMVSNMFDVRSSIIEYFGEEFVEPYEWLCEHYSEDVGLYFATILREDKDAGDPTYSSAMAYYNDRVAQYNIEHGIGDIASFYEKAATEEYQDTISQAVEACGTDFDARYALLKEYFWDNIAAEVYRVLAKDDGNQAAADVMFDYFTATPGAACKDRDDVATEIISRHVAINAVHGQEYAKKYAANFADEDVTFKEALAYGNILTGKDAYVSDMWADNLHLTTEEYFRQEADSFLAEIKRGNHATPYGSTAPGPSASEFKTPEEENSGSSNDPGAGGNSGVGGSSSSSGGSTPVWTSTEERLRNMHYYDDVPQDAWYTVAINAMTEGGLLKGCGDGLFHPADYITVGEFATILCRIGGIDCSNDNFKPGKYMGGDKYYTEPYNWAHMAIDKVWDTMTLMVAPDQAERAVIRGESLGALQFVAFRMPSYYSSGTTTVGGNGNYFKQVSEKLWNAEDIPDLDVILANENRTRSEGYITPLGILDAYNLGITKGVDEKGTCNPLAPLTRAELCQLLYNMGLKYDTSVNMLGNVFKHNPKYLADRYIPPCYGPLYNGFSHKFRGQ